MTSWTASLVILLLPLLALTAQSADTADQAEAAALVQELRDFSAELTALARPGAASEPREQRRAEIYERLRHLNADAIPALCRGLKDPDVGVRRNVALALTVVAGGWYKPSEPRLDIRSCLPELIQALSDTDSLVRARAAHAIGDIGAQAGTAVPSLLTLLEYPDEASRIGACIAFRDIGSGASDALPALRRALEDTSEDVRQFASQATQSIQGLRGN